MIKCTLSMQIRFTETYKSLERPDGNGKLAFLDISSNVNGNLKIKGHWYQMSTDNVETLNCHSCAPLQHQQNLIKRTFHQIFTVTSDLKNNKEALINQDKISGQETSKWSTSIINEKNLPR